MKLHCKGKIDKLLKYKTIKLKLRLIYKRVHNSCRAERLKLVTFELFLVSSLKLFHKDMEWSWKDLGAVDVLLKVMLMLFFCLSGVVAMDGGALDQLGFEIIWSEAM